MESRVYRDKFKEMHQNLIVRQHGLEVSGVHRVVHFMPKGIHISFKTKKDVLKQQ